MSTLESKIGDFLFDTSCELGLKGNDLLQQCIQILQQKMSKIKPSDLQLMHPTALPAHTLSLEIPSSTRATPGSRAAFSPYSSAFSSRSPMLRAASKESCVLLAEQEAEEDDKEKEEIEEGDQLNTSMDSEDVNLVDGLSDATIGSHFINDFSDEMESNTDDNITNDTSIVSHDNNNNDNNNNNNKEMKPKRKRAPRPVDPLKAAMKARKEELSKEKQAQKEAKAAEKQAKAAEKEANNAGKEMVKKSKDSSDVTDGEAKQKRKRKVAEASSNSTSSSAEPEKKRRRSRKALDVKDATVVVSSDGDEDMFGDREDKQQVARNNETVEEDAEVEIQGFIDEDNDDDDGVSIDGGEVEDIWQKKVIDGKPYTISSMTNKFPVPAPIISKKPVNQPVRALVDDNVSEMSEESEMSLDF